jgi:hypothetical protein
MKIFNALELFKQISDPYLYETVCAGFMYIYETTDSTSPGMEYFSEKIDPLNYSKALTELRAYTSGADTLEKYTQLMGDIANRIALTQASVSKNDYATVTKNLDHDMTDTQFKTFNDEMMHLLPTFSGHNDIEEYIKAIPPDLLQSFVDQIGGMDKFVDYANTFIYYHKLTALLHDIKHDIMALMKAKK